MTTSTPTYFGDPALFGVVHLPDDGQVRGGVLLCPSLAKESYDTVRGMRRLADDLAARGLAVLRFDYHATGDSSGAHGTPDAVDGWLRSTRAAYEYLGSLGVGDIAVVGLRVGALLAAQVLPDLNGVRAAVLWDPVAHGRRWLREQAALFSIATAALPAELDDGGVAVLGMELHPDAADALRALKLCAPTCPTLLVQRADGPDKALARLAEEADQVELVGAEGMRKFVTPDSFLVAIPYPAIDTVVRWIDDRFGADTNEVSFAATAEAVVSAPGEPLVRERIERIEPEGMVAIRALPGDREPDGRAVVLYTTANDTHHGPGREWVALSRECAANGVEALRFDRLGIGESGPVADDELTPIFSRETRTEALSATRHAGTDPSRMLAAGVCSGSWYAASTGRQLGVGRVVMVNAIAWSWRRKRSAEGKVTPEDLGMPRSSAEWQHSFRGRTKALLQNHLPYLIWRELGRRGITQVPEVLLGRLARSGVRTSVLLCEPDMNWFTTQRGPEGMARMERRPGAARVQQIPGDHSAFHPAARAEIRREVLDWVREGA